MAKRTNGKGGASKGSEAGASKGTEVVQAALQGVVPCVRQGERVFPTDRRNGSKVGMVHGLLLTAWFNGVFDLLATGNAVVADDGSGKPVYSDEAIHAAMRAEYPNASSKQATSIDGVRAYRGYYNNGQHGLGAVVDGVRWLAPKPQVARKAKPAAVPAVPMAKPVPTAKAK